MGNLESHIINKTEKTKVAMKLETKKGRNELKKKMKVIIWDKQRSASIKIKKKWQN